MTQATKKVDPQVEGNPAKEQFVEEAGQAGMPPWLEAAFPWAVSVTGHLGLFLVFAFALYVNAHQPQDDTEKIVIPASFADESNLPMVEHPGIDGDPNRDARQNINEFAKTQGWAQTESKDNVASMLEGSEGDNVVDMIATGTGGSVGRGNGGVGKGSGGVQAPYGVPGGGRGIGVKFFEQKATAKKIVYILDHSGSMLDTFDFLRQEAIRSVNQMIPVQSFGVVMFSERASVIYPQLQRATTETKKDFASKLQNFRAQGMNDDLLDPGKEAFEAAFQLQPEVIYFLTDGRFDPRLIEIVTNQLNKAKKVRVNTLAFVINDPISEDQLKELAKKNGGVYKFVSEKDLGKGY
ncbi:MAG: VWA domain-containing protein [Phycisphaerales bacterium]|nr:VWA domain-containing protein [Phycisphaerales bacterium]